MDDAIFAKTTKKSSVLTIDQKAKHHSAKVNSQKRDDQAAFIFYWVGQKVPLVFPTFGSSST